jgi:hypothetical protein
LAENSSGTYGTLGYRVWVEVIELKTIEIKKATKEVGCGEGQSPFEKSVETK